MNPEVLIIGGGVIGLSIARELHRQGAKRISLLEKGRCGEEASWAAAGMLGPQAEADGPSPFLDLCCASRDLYPEFAAELLDETGIDIELEKTGTLCLAFTDKDEEELHERRKWQHESGLHVEHLSGEEVLLREPSISKNLRDALFFPNDWQVENRRLIAALERYSVLNGIEIRENTKVKNIFLEDDRIIGVETTDCEIFQADIIIIATGAWTSLIKIGGAGLAVKVEPVRGQMLMFQTPQRAIRHVIYSSGGYLVPRMDGRILAGSTSEHAGFEKSVTQSAVISLRNMAAVIFPEIEKLEIADSWSGLRPFAADGLPILGSIESINNLFIATAHYRNGILLAPMTAKITADHLLNGKDPHYLNTFAPGRFQMHSMYNAGM
jgi:glycine oxidase